MPFSKSDFRYYFAVEKGNWGYFSQWLRGEDLLISFSFLKNMKSKSTLDLLDGLKKHKGHIMLDSGAFTNYATPGFVKYEEWEEFAKEAKTQSWVDEYVQFDDIHSRRKTIEYWERSNKAGVKTLFVDHLNRRTEMNYVNGVWRNEDKICCGGFAKTLPGHTRFQDGRNRVVEAVEKARAHNTAIHLLAIGSFTPFMHVFDTVHSVDSASWDKIIAYGMFKALDFREIGPFRVPVLTAFDRPGRSKAHRPIPTNKKADVWDGAFNDWDIASHRFPLRLQSRAVSLWNVRRYVRELKKFPFDKFRTWREEEQKKGTTKKFYSFPELYDDIDLIFSEMDYMHEATEKARGPWKQFGGSSGYSIKLVERFPEHKTYVEPFMGAASCLFTKERSEVEVLCDLDPEAVFAMKFIQKWTEETTKAFERFDLVSSRETYERAKSMTPKGDLERFWKFVALKGFSWGGLGTGYSAADEGMKIRANKYEPFAKRLEGVVIKCQSYEKTIKEYDGKDTFFYIDPPYPDGWDRRASGTRTENFDMDLFADRVSKLRGRYIVTHAGTDQQKEQTKSIPGERFTLRGRNSSRRLRTRVAFRHFIKKAEWSRAFINDLPDEAFLHIEPGGEIDEEGKTKPRRLRRFPIRDADGKIDLPHLRNAIARIPQAKIPGLDEAGLRGLQDEARRLLEEEKRREKLAKASGTVRLIKTQGTDERYVLGIVLEPNDGKGGAPMDPDSQNDIYSKAEVRQAAYRFMEEFRNVGLMHRMLVNGKVKILESFVVPEGTGGFEITDPKGRKQSIREGTWLLGLRIADDKLWHQVKTDELRGLSIGGSARRVEAKP